MSALVHYGLTLEEFAARAQKHTSCFDANAPRPICGNGSYHAMVTRSTGAVTCPECLKRMPKGAA